MKSFIPWMGGKSLLAKKIVEQFPDDIDRYIEVFGGGGSVLFYEGNHAKLEVYNRSTYRKVKKSAKNSLFRNEEAVYYKKGEFKK